MVNHSGAIEDAESAGFDLILAKEAIGREKDLRAVVDLRAIREKLKET